MEKENVKKKSDWNTTDKRFVAFLDILGFKDMVMRNTHEDIYEKLKEISYSRKLLEESPYDLSFFGDAEICTVSFSDSIILFSKDDSIGNFECFLHSVTILFADAIRNDLPIKGGIAYGKISLDRDKQIYFGQAIIDAYLIEEEVNYLGITAHNSIDSYINNSDEAKAISNVYLFECETPLRSGSICHFNTDWFYTFACLVCRNNLVEKSITKEIVKNSLKSFRMSCSGSPRRYIDNTLDFLKKLYSKN